MTQTNQHTVDRSHDDKISLLYQLGKSTLQIAEEFGIDRKHVRRALRRTGTAVRTPAEAREIRRVIA